MSMDKIAIVYWSGSGNTEQMARSIAEGAARGGASVSLLSAKTCKSEIIDQYDGFIFGCPAMGDEVLEECEFEPFFLTVETRLKEKRVALFGSYGWGDGEWMQNWERRVRAAGVEMDASGLIIQGAPDSEGVKQCERFGARFAGAEA